MVPATVALASVAAQVAAEWKRSDKLELNGSLEAVLLGEPTTEPDGDANHGGPEAGEGEFGRYLIGLEAEHGFGIYVPVGFDLLGTAWEIRHVFTTNEHFIADLRSCLASVAAEMGDDMAKAAKWDMQRIFHERRQANRPTRTMLEALRRLGGTTTDQYERQVYRRKARRLEEAQSQADYSIGWLREESAREAER